MDRPKHVRGNGEMRATVCWNAARESGDNYRGILHVEIWSENVAAGLNLLWLWCNSEGS
jgi:hypothetical protein